MKAISLPRVLVIATVGIVALATAPALFADGGHGGRCTNWSVSGAYGYTSTGTRVGVGPVAGVGLVTLNRDGSVDGKQTVSFNGTIADETLTGNYTVNDDCTGQLTVNVVSSIPTLNRTSSLDLVWVNRAEAIHAIFTGAGTIITIDGSKVGQ